MTLPDSAQQDRFESFIPTVRDDTLVRRYGQEAVVWPTLGIPLHLNPVGAVVLDMLDGHVSLSELADDIHATLGVPRTVALDQLRSIVGTLESGGVLTTSDLASPAFPTDSHFYGPPNP